MKNASLKIILFTLTIFLVASCSSELPIETDLSKAKFQLVTQDSTVVNFPEFVKGKKVIMGFIFTNCPDICPLTTNNMRLIQEALKSNDVENFEMVSLSFDPEVDSPKVLQEYAELRNLDLSNWTFLTGNKNTTDSLIKAAGVFAVPGDTSTTPSGKEIIFYVHTDRIAFLDEQGRIRKNYFGSKINIDEIVTDILNY